MVMTPIPKRTAVKASNCPALSVCSDLGLRFEILKHNENRRKL
jgi:hypothetical protein